MKKLIGLFIGLTMILTMSLQSAATNEQQLPLSDLSDEECIAFLKEYGVEIPVAFDDELVLATFVRSIIEQVEANPQIIFAYGSAMMYTFTNDIKCAVNDYYGISEDLTCYTTRQSGYTLVDSVVVGQWDPEYTNYNCYAYAIGLEYWLDPGYIHWVENGNSGENYLFNTYANIETIAEWVQQDLEDLGYVVDSVSETRPNITVNDHTHLICVRKDADGVFLGYNENGEPVYFHDYHFMKLGSDGSWYHKPGGTQPLEYLYEPSVHMQWLSEYYDGSTQTYGLNPTTYDSYIYYITYTTPHVYEYVHHSNTHTYTCTICGDTPLGTESCNYVYAFIGTVNGVNKHTRYCQDCGHIQLAEALCMYKNGDTCICCGVSRDVIMEPSSSTPSTKE